jgi:HEAT repeat protein
LNHIVINVSKSKQGLLHFLLFPSGSRRVVGALLIVFLLCTASPGIVFAAPSFERQLREARHAFDQKQYDQTLTAVEPLLKEPIVSTEARRLKIKSLIRLARPVDAFSEYEHLYDQLKQDDRSLLHEVAIAFITPMLKDMREQMRGAAYTALKELDSDEGIPYFEDGLSDGSGLIRALAVEGLGRLPAGRRSATLNKALEDQAGMVRAAAIKVVGRSGDSAALGKIQRALKDEQAVVRITAAGVLAKLKHGEGWDRVRESTTVPNPEERATALRMLGEIKDRRGLLILKEALTDTQPSVRGAAAAAMGDLNAMEAVPFLLEAIHDRLPAVRAAAIVSLGELSATTSVSAIREALHDVNLPVRAAAVSSLLHLGVPYDEVVPTVHELAQNIDPGVRSAIARALSKGKTREAIFALESFLEDPLPRPRIAAVRSLGQSGDIAEIPVLKRVLRDQDEAVRATAGGALGRILSHARKDSADKKNVVK